MFYNFEWINKFWYFQTIKIQTTDTLRNMTNLKCNMINEERQSQKTTYNMSPFIWHSG